MDVFMLKIKEISMKYEAISFKTILTEAMKCTQPHSGFSNFLDFTIS